MALFSVSFLSNLPGFHVAGQDAEEGMHRHRMHPADPGMPLRCASGEFRQQVLSFVADLAFGYPDQIHRFHRASDLGGIEPVAPPLSLLQNHRQIGPDGRKRFVMDPEAHQLRVVAVAPGAAFQDGLGKESLAPQGHQALGVQKGRMQGPESNDGLLKVLRVG